MSDPTSDRLWMREMAYWYVRQWRLADELEHGRVVPNTSTSWADHSLHVLSVRNLLRAAELAGFAYRDGVGEEIKAALSRFAKRVPRLVEARSVL